MGCGIRVQRLEIEGWLKMMEIENERVLGLKRLTLTYGK